MRTYSSLLVFFSLIFSISAYSAEQCGAINCDCYALENLNWQETCRKRQLAMVDACQKGKKGYGYCSVHGPAASPLPLALELSEEKVLDTDSLSSLYKKVAAIYWATHKDLDYMTENADKTPPVEFEGKVKAILANVESLFSIQKQITQSWNKSGNADEAQSSWRDFSSDQYAMGRQLEEAGRLFWRVGGQRAAEERKSFETMSFDLIKTSGKVLEQAAHAYAQSGQHGKAASNWQEASQSLEFLIGIISARAPNSREVEDLRFLQAARMYRASYHWALEKKESEAENSLKKASEIFNGKVDAAAG